MNLPQENLDLFVEALRSELHGYGELLALMESQQGQIISRDTMQIECSTQKINEQFKVIQQLKSVRCKHQADISLLLGLLPDAEYGEQRNFLPPDFRNLTDALVEENNGLLKQVKTRARQNQMLLFRTVEVMQEFINHLLPRNEVNSYNATGSKQSTSIAHKGLYEAIG